MSVWWPLLWAATQFQAVWFFVLWSRAQREILELEEERDRLIDGWHADVSEDMAARWDE